MTAFWKRALGAASLAASMAAGAAADFPSAPITIVVPVAAGGALDLAGRTLAQHLKDRLGQAVVIENKPGGSGNIAYTRVARAKPDGYTLLFSYEGFHVGSPAVNKGLPWDPVKSFTPVAEITRGPHVITVPKDFPAQDLQAFITMARSGDQPLNYGSAGVGSLQHLGTEQFKLLTQAKITHIPYNGAAPAMQDLLAGRVQLLITTPPTVLQQIQSGHLRGLAITSAKRHPMLPDVPTTAEAGLPEFQLEAWFSIFGPADMPLDIVQKLETAIQAVVTSQSFRDQITKQGSYASYQGAREVAQQVSKDLVRWADVVRRAHIQAE